MATATKRPRPKAPAKKAPATTQPGASKPKTAKVATKAPVKAKRPIAVKPRPSAKNLALAVAAEKKAKKAKAAGTKNVAGNGQTLNAYGFMPGTDSALIVEAMLAGGDSRIDVNNKAEALIEKKNGLLTRSNKPKNVPSLASAVLARLIERGFTVESTWVIHPPKDLKAAESDLEDASE